MTTLSTEVTHILAYDVEATGQGSKHHMIEIGAVLWKVGDREPVDTFYAFMGLEGKWCDRTKAEFWDNPEKGKDGKTPLEALKARLADTPVSTREAAANAFVEWARKCNDTADSNVVLISDTAGFDYLQLANLLEECTSVDEKAAYPACYPWSPLYVFGKYRPTRDMSSFLMGAGGVLVKWSSKRELLKQTGPMPKWVTDFEHSHHPLDDAKSIAATMSWALTQGSENSPNKKRKTSPPPGDE